MTERVVLGFWIASKATLLILEYAFDDLDLEKIKLRVKVDHFKAYDLYQKIGFKEIDRDEKLIHMEIKRKNWEWTLL